MFESHRNIVQVTDLTLQHYVVCRPYIPQANNTMDTGHNLVILNLEALCRPYIPQANNTMDTGHNLVILNLEALCRPYIPQANNTMDTGHNLVILCKLVFSKSQYKPEMWIYDVTESGTTTMKLMEMCWTRLA